MKNKNHPMRIWLLVLLLLTLLLVCLAYITKDCNTWASNVLLSVACGVVSGFTIYMLGNYRSSKYDKLTFEYSLLQDTDNKIKEVLWDVKYKLSHRFLSYLEDLEIDEYMEQVLERTDIVIDDILNYPASLFSALDIDIDSTTLFDISPLRNKYREIIDISDEIGVKESENILLEIENILSELTNRIKVVKKKTKEQIDALDNYPY